MKTRAGKKNRACADRKDDVITIYIASGASGDSALHIVEIENRGRRYNGRSIKRDR